MQMFARSPIRFSFLLLATCVALAGCKDTETDEPSVPPPHVAVAVVQPQTITIRATLPGRVNALRTAEIRPQVSGIVQHRLFEQGAEIKQGMPLFQINPAPFVSEVENAQAALLRAQAVWDKEQKQLARLRPLIESQVVSRQSYDDAVSSEKQAAADVAQARATLARKKLDLSFATVDAPISGRIDQTLVTEGAYVTASDTNPLARIYQTDPIYVDVRQPAEDYHALRQQFSAQNETNASLPVTILRPDGAAYAQPGKILFSGISVDTGTGEVMVRVEVSNPHRELLPGMFVRVQMPRQHYDYALMVPQQAIVRQNDKPSLWVIDEQQRAQHRDVEIAEIANGQYRISRGVNAGDHIVVQGMDKLGEGMKVEAVRSSSSPAGYALAGRE